MEKETVDIVSNNPDEQGPFVRINKEDFDELIHVLYVPEPEIKTKK